ncbi:MAG: tRNA-uridine aminocarboxypropyltransferase [Polyangiaceae bacterium]
MTETIRGRRLPRCDGCGLPPLLCMCAELPSLSLRTQIVLVMHKNEVGRSSNTGRLALKCVRSARAVIRGMERAEPNGSERRLLLFPSPEARPLSAADGASDDPVTLVVPDGSWTQARRATRREPWCRGAELVKLDAPAPGHYGLRRSPRPEALCTLEAIARALGILEGAAVEHALLDVLARFVVRARHLRAAGGSLGRPTTDDASATQPERVQVARRIHHD